MEKQRATILVFNVIQTVSIAQEVRLLALIATHCGSCIKVLAFRLAQFKHSLMQLVENVNLVTIIVTFVNSLPSTAQFAIQQANIFPI
jgi:hypothetical protein